jgi:hypothetical protein
MLLEVLLEVLEELCWVDYLVEKNQEHQPALPMLVHESQKQAMMYQKVEDEDQLLLLKRQHVGVKAQLARWLLV